jgi:hypothetical protein
MNIDVIKTLVVDENLARAVVRREKERQILLACFIVVRNLVPRCSISTNCGSFCCSIIPSG